VSAKVWQEVLIIRLRNRQIRQSLQYHRDLQIIHRDHQIIHRDHRNRQFNLTRRRFIDWKTCHLRKKNLKMAAAPL
jgi:hypothetical protein